MTTDADSLETSPLSEADQQLLKIGRDLAADPKTRKEYLKLIKAKYPDQPIPELDTEAAMMKFAEGPLKELAALKKERLAEKVERDIAARRQELKDQGFGSDDVKAIEEMMVKEQIPSHATAANYYKLQRQAAVPTTTALDLVNKMPVDKKTIKDAGGIKNWARNEAGKAVDDLKSGRVKFH